MAMWKLSENHWINPDNVSDIYRREDGTFVVHFSADESIHVVGNECVALRDYLDNPYPEGFQH